MDSETDDDSIALRSIPTRNNVNLFERFIFNVLKHFSSMCIIALVTARGVLRLLVSACVRTD